MLALQRPPKPVVRSCDPESQGLTLGCQMGCQRFLFKAEGTQDGVVVFEQEGQSIHNVVLRLSMSLSFLSWPLRPLRSLRLLLLISGAGGCFTSYTLTQD